MLADLVRALNNLVEVILQYFLVSLDTFIYVFVYVCFYDHVYVFLVVIYFDFSVPTLMGWPHRAPS